MNPEVFWDHVIEPFGRRPVFGAAVLMCIGICIGLCAKIRLFILIGVLLFMILFLRVRKGKIRKTSFFLLAFFFAGYFLTILASQPGDLESMIYNQKQSFHCEAQGIIEDVRHSQYGRQYVLKNVEIRFDENTSREEYSHILVQSGLSADLGCEIGSYIHVYGEASGFDTPTNPGQFDTRLYYLSRKIPFKIKAGRIVTISPNSNPFLKFTAFCSEELNAVFYRLAEPKYASVLCALLLGNREDLDEELSELFTVCGIGHVLAISGLHISLLGMGLYKILRRLGIHSVPAMIIGVSFIVFYGLLTGNGTSTVRAGIMFAVAVYANVCKRSYDVLTASSFAAILMLADCPYLITSCGFLLSYGAILGITLVGEAFQRIFHTRNKIIRGFLGSLSIQLITLPVTLYFYFQTPVLSVLLNLIVIPLMSVVMISALAGGLMGLLHDTMGAFLIGPSIYVLQFYEWLCRQNLRIDYAFLTPGRPRLWQILAYYSVLILFLYLAKYGHAAKKFSALLPVILCLIILLVPWNARRFQVTFLDVGQGDGIFIRCDDGTTILIDGGSLSTLQLYPSVLEPFLLSEGVTRLDYCIVTHADSDHISGLKSLLKEGKIKVGEVLLPYMNSVDETYEALEILAEQESKVGYIHANMSLTAGNVTINCLHPGVDFNASEKNCYSTSLLVTYHDFSLLTCGDLCEEEEEKIAASWGNKGTVDVFKACHHGSRYSNSEELLRTICPNEVVISAGKNNSYGHPHAQTLERLEQIGAVIRRTDFEGAISYFPE